MRFFLPIVALFACVSCGPNSVPVKSVQANDAIGGANVHIERAQTDVKRALPHTSKLGEPYLLDAGENLVGATGKLEQVRKGLVELQEAHGKLLVESGKKDTIIESYKGRWVGDQTFHWLRVAILVTVLATVGLFAARIYGGGWIASAAGGILHFLPFPAVPAADKIKALLGR